MSEGLDLSDRDPDEPDEQSPAPVDRAFSRSEEHRFKGAALYPFSFLRRTAAAEIGLKFGVVPEDEIVRRPNPQYLLRVEAEKQLAKLKQRSKKREELAKLIAALKDEEPEMITYHGVATDAARVIWLCLQTDSVCQRARRRPREYETEIDKWAERQGFLPGSEVLREAVDVFSAIMAEIQASEFQPHSEGGKEEEQQIPN